MSGIYLSNESQDGKEYPHTGPNQFCMWLFQKQSIEDFQLYPASSIQPIDLKQPSASGMFWQGLKIDTQPSLEFFIKTDDQKEILSNSVVVPAIRDYKKNICRNVLRHAIRALNNPSSEQFLLKLLDQKQTEDLVTYYQSNLESFSGFRTLKNEILNNPETSKEENDRREAFRQYLIWFMKNKATICILKGEASNIKQYLAYKNEVLGYYLNKPELWFSNKPLWKLPMKKINSIKKQKSKKRRPKQSKEF